jgi:diguanylate cyclase (GGDEF)-like protein
VNKAYLSRIKENINQINIQKFVSDISYDFVNVSEQNLNEKVNCLLEHCGKFFSADCACIAWFDEDHSTIDHTFQWHKNEEESDKKGIVPLDPFPCLIDKFGLDQLILIRNVQKLPPEAEEIKNKLIYHNIRTLILIPIKTQKAKIGFLGFSASEPVEKLNLQSTSAIETIANIISSALEKVKNEKEIKYMAYFDQLTRLPNRLLFTDRANQEISIAKRTVKMVAIVFIDLDSFKSINDSLGHEQGDELLIEVANIISKCVRNSDTVSRFTGDKFVVLLNNISSSEDVVKIASKIIEMFNKPISLKDQEIFTTASIGIAIYPKDGEDVETLIKNADTAMYKAKNRGKNQYMLCSEDMKDEVLEEMRLTNLLYRAKERNQLVLFYQPQILLETNQIVGFEALVRWNLPGSGLISPLKFIPIAERTGLINSIGEWVIRTACIQSKAWQDAGFPKLRMAVNISVHQLRNPYLVSQIDGILKETGLSPQYLELEITESVAARQNDNFITLLNKLKELGVTISIDDFGTEYSSLSRLKTLPIDRIKMDMQFVHGIEGSDKDKAITDVIINLAKSLGLKVLAEGVETMPQLHFLNRKMCDEVQGFYFYRPLPAKEIEKILGGTVETLLPFRTDKRVIR